MSMKNWKAAFWATLGGLTAVLLLSQLDARAFAPGPEIDVWYGDEQTFGQNGVPQEWINILGNVSDLDSEVVSLTYSLNGGATEEISIGPFDGTGASERLTYEGDFNVEIAYADLNPGQNTVELTAQDGLSNISTQTVTVTYQSGNTWPLPTTIDWSTVSNINDVAQVVDGNWIVESDSVRPAPGEIGYDRLIAIGDMTDWTDYEATVPITIHSYDTVQGQPFSESGLPGGLPGVGLMMRWQGHDDDTAFMMRTAAELFANYEDLLPYSAYGVFNQPLTGWQQHGALAWYRWFNNNENNARLRFTGNVLTDASYVDNSPQLRLDFGTTYNFKLRGVSIENEAPFYTMRVWEAGTEEPSEWNVLGRGTSLSTDNGSLLLVAHKLDVSFGDVTITPITDTTPVVTVATNGSGSVNVSPPPNAGDGGYIYGTEVTITATPNLGSAFAGWLGDLFGEASNSVTVTLTDDLAATAVFTTDLSGIDSDDFNLCGLSNLWSFSDPLGNASLAYDGQELLINVPGGTAHQPWNGGNNAPRIMQPANDQNLGVELKFSTLPPNTNDMQGVIVEESEGNYLRIDVNRRSGGSLRLFAAAFENNSQVGGTFSQDIGNVAANYMRVLHEQTTSTWAVQYSVNGTDWQDGLTFNRDLAVSSIGAFAGNAGSSPTAWTSQLDYFFTLSSPIVPEDPDTITHSLTVNLFGEGSVTRDPQKSSYACGETVTLTAVPESGWLLDGWGGAATGSAASTSVTIEGETAVSATFVEVEESLFLPFVQN